jgi:hypothetical protein
MAQFSLKRMMLAIACFCATCAYWKLLPIGARDQAPWAEGPVLFGCILLGFSGFGMSAGILVGRVWVGLAVTVVVSFLLPWIIGNL